MDKDLIPVEGSKTLYRDRKSGAIVNYDTNEYNQYIKIKNNRLKEREEIDQLKKDINEIKFLLREILNGNNGTK
jgi:hypothetical protein